MHCYDKIVHTSTKFLAMSSGAQDLVFHIRHDSQALRSRLSGQSLMILALKLEFH